MGVLGVLAKQRLVPKINHLVAKTSWLRSLLSGLAHFPDTGICQFDVSTEEQLLVRTYSGHGGHFVVLAKDAMEHCCHAFSAASLHIGLASLNRCWLPQHIHVCSSRHT